MIKEFMCFLRIKLNFDRRTLLARDLPGDREGEIKIECRRDGLKCVKQRDGNESQIPVRMEGSRVDDQMSEGGSVGCRR